MSFALVVAVVGLVVAALVVLAVVAIAKSSKAAMEAFDRAWGEAAAELRMTYTPREGPWHSPTPANIQGQLHGVPVRVDLVVESSTSADGTDSSQIFTRATSVAAAGLALDAALYPTSSLSPLARMLGFQDVIVGDAAIDAAFVIKADDERLVRQLLGPRLRSALLEFPKRITYLRYEKGAVDLRWEGMEVEPAVLRAALVLAALAATHDGR